MNFDFQWKHFNLPLTPISQEGKDCKTLLINWLFDNINFGMRIEKAERSV